MEGSEEPRTGWDVRPGTLIFYGDTSAVALSADTVRVGQPLGVSATTFGSGCTRRAGTRTEVHDLKATLVPLDSVYAPGTGGGCTAVLKHIDHDAKVAFERAGEARVTIQGVGREADLEGPKVVQFERTVTVIE